YVASTNRNNALGIMQLSEHSPNLPEDAIVFIIYQGGHSFSFICSSEGDNPPVHMFLERGDRAEMIWNYSPTLEEFCLMVMRGWVK
ncbi:MAG TPA: hypothetical protein V6C57_07985, partial [Coleofasciculaceae cyanobacterium]